MKIVSRLLIAVIETDSATSPPARWVRMLETFPGGQQATRIMPSAIEPRTSSSDRQQQRQRRQQHELRHDADRIGNGRRSTAVKSVDLDVQRDAEEDRRDHDLQRRQRRPS